MKLSRRASIKSLVGAVGAVVVGAAVPVEARNAAPRDPQAAADIAALVAKLDNYDHTPSRKLISDELRIQWIKDHIETQPWYQEFIKQRVMEQMGLSGPTASMVSGYQIQQINGELWRSWKDNPADSEYSYHYAINPSLLDDISPPTLPPIRYPADLPMTPAAFDLKIDGKPYKLGKSRGRNYTARTITKT